MKRYLISALVFGVVAVGSATAQSVDHYERVLAGAYAPDGPGATAIVARGDEVVFLGAAGLANVELGIPLAPDMVFEIGSITKQFTAAGIMMLAEQGKLSTDDLLSKFLPDYPGGDAVTVEHLLTHTSGIVSYTGIPGYMATKVRLDMSPEEIIDEFKDRPVEFTPGDRWAYNNSGYILLGAIIERVSGQSYEDFVEQQIFKVLGMTSARYGHRDEVIPRRASGYVGQPGSYENAQYLSMTQPYAAGSLMMNVEDWVRWSRALYRGEVVSLESVQRMVTPFVLNGGDTTTYGYGLGVGEIRDRHTVQHGGGIFGYATSGTYIPGEDVFVAVFSNIPNAGMHGITATRLAAAALGEPYPVFDQVDVDPAILARYEGVYEMEDGVDFSVWVEDGALHTQRVGSQRRRATAASETKFFYRNVPPYIEFVVADGHASAVMIHLDGGPEAQRAARTGDAPARKQAITLDAAVLERYVGVYTIGPDFDLTISRDGAALSGQASGQGAFPLQAMSETGFFNDGIGFEIEFIVEDGAVVAAMIRQGAREIRAERKPQ